jgi:hypothetical protein
LELERKLFALGIPFSALPRSLLCLLFLLFMFTMFTMFVTSLVYNQLERMVRAHRRCGHPDFCGRVFASDYTSSHIAGGRDNPTHCFRWPARTPSAASTARFLPLSCTFPPAITLGGTLVCTSWAFRAWVSGFRGEAGAALARGKL